MMEGYWRTESSNFQCRSDVLECRKALLMLRNQFVDPTVNILSGEVLFVEGRVVPVVDPGGVV